jgi:putative inorganic carbon (HCO3(-)) transporter
MLPFHLHFGLESIVATVLYLGMWVTFLLSTLGKPHIGVYVLAFFLPLQTVRYRIHGMFLGSQFVDILLLGVVLGLLLQGRAVTTNKRLSKFLLFLGVFYYFSLWEGSFFVNAPLPLWISDPRFSDWKNYVEMFFLATVVSSAIRDQKQIRVLLLVMALSLLGLNRNYMNLLSGRDLSHFSYEIRDEGLMGYAGVNGLAAFEAMMFSVLLAGYVYARRIWLKLALAMLGASCVYCLLYSFSRGGYVGALAGLVAIGLLKARRLLVVAALIFLTWQVLLPVSVQERIKMTTETTDTGELADHSAEQRLVLWEDAIDLFRRNPVSGAGFQTYKYMDRVGPYHDTHNYFVNILVETGLVGMVLFLTLLWKLTRLGFDLFVRAADHPFLSALGLGFVALMASSVVANCFGDRWTYQQVDGYLWILLGCVISGLRFTNEINEVKKPEESVEVMTVWENTFENAVER